MSWGLWVPGCSELVAQHHLVPTDGRPPRSGCIAVPQHLNLALLPGRPAGSLGSQTLFSSTADVANPSAITDAAKIVEGKLNGTGLNLLINNAGIYTPAASLETVDAEEMIMTYKTNAVGPMLMAQVWMKLWGWSSPRRGNLAQLEGSPGCLWSRWRSRSALPGFPGLREGGGSVKPVLRAQALCSPPALRWANWEQAGSPQQNTRALLASRCSSSSSLL